MSQWSLILAGPAFIFLALAVTGCDSGEFVPAPPEELRTSIDPGSTLPRAAIPSSVENPQTNGAEFISVKRTDPDEIELIRGAVRTQAGYDKIRVKTVGIGDFSSKPEEPAPQADLVRKAISRHPRALIIEVENSKDAELAAAVNEARAAGIIVVLAGPPLANASPNASTAPTPKGTAKLAPVIAVGPTSFTQSATDLVASALRNAENAGIADRKSAVILIAPSADSMVEQRAAAVKTALEAAGITEVQEFRFPHDVPAIDKKLTELLKSNPKLGLVFAADLITATAVIKTLDELIPDRPFVASAYTWESNQLKSISYAQFAAVAEYNPLRLIRRAITAAANAMERGEAPAIVDIPVVSQDSPPLSKLSRSQTILTKTSQTK